MKTQILCSVTFVKNRAAEEIMWKNTVQPDSSEKTTQIRYSQIGQRRQHKYGKARQVREVNTNTVQPDRSEKTTQIRCSQTGQRRQHKYGTARQVREDNTNTAHEFCSLDNQGYKHTLKIFNNYFFSTGTVVTRMRLNVT